MSEGGNSGMPQGETWGKEGLPLKIADKRKRITGKQSQETIAKRVEKLRGQKRPPRSEESLHKFSQAQKRLWEDPEYRQKMVELHSGKKQSKETIEKRIAKIKGKPRSPRKQKTCLFCGKELSLAEWEKNRKFCSTTCKGKWQSENAIGEKGAHWKGGGVTKKCEECGKEFSVEKYRKETARFCSTACKGKWMSKNLVGERNPSYGKPGKITGSNHPQWKGGDVIKKCEECGKEYTVEQFRKDTARFCSTTCKGIWMSKNLVRESNPTWHRISKICEECGKEFYVKSRRENTARFCSRTCRAKSKSVIKNCEECGKEFVIGIYREDTARFCSFSCKGKWMSKNIVGEQHPEWKGGDFTKKCAECGKEYAVPNCRKDNSRFCSPKCKGVWLSKNYAGEKNPQWRRTQKICEICGKEFYVKTRRKETGRFCSSKCRSIWMSQTFTGENNWNWTGGSKDYCEKWSPELRCRIRAFF
jgi:endogenous inhibitor of DNA gyrase (YacG/DUF329 family)